MADIEVGDLVAKISFDDTGLNKSIAEINRQMKLVQSEFDKASSELKAYGDSETAAAAKSDALTKQMALQQQKINVLNAEFQKSVQEKGDDAAATQKLAVKLNEAQAAYNKLAGDLKKINVQLDDQDDAFKKAGASIEDMGKKLSVISAASFLNLTNSIKDILAPLGDMLSLSTDLDKALNNVKTATGNYADENGELEKSIVTLFNQNLGENFDDIGKSLAKVGQVSGKSGSELEGLTKNALLVRDAFGFEIDESVKAADSLMKQFGISGDQAFTLIAQGAQNGADRSGELLDSLNEYAPQFKALGFSADQFTNVLIDGAANGAFQIDKVGDAVKEFNIQAKDGSTTTIDAFTSLGLSADQLAAQFAAGGASAQTAFTTTITALNGITDPLEKNRIGVELFGTQFEDLEAGAIAALGNIGTTANSSADTLKQINEIQFSDVGSALQGIGRNLETGVFLPLGEKVLPKVQEFANYLIANMPQIQSAISSALDVVIGLFDDFADAIKFVVDNMDILLPVIAGVTAAITAQMIINALNKAYAAWSTATKTQTTLQWLLNAALDANPLGLVAIAIGAVVAAGVLLYKNWDTIKEKLGEFWDFLKDIGGKIKSFFGDVFDGLVTGFKGYVNIWVSALNFLIRALNKLQFDIPDWVPNLGGKKFGINIPQIPMLANGGDIAQAGRVLVGEAGPELLDLPRGARVTPLSGPNAPAAGPQTVVAEVYLDSTKVATAIAKPQADMARRRARGLGMV